MAERQPRKEGGPSTTTTRVLLLLTLLGACVFLLSVGAVVYLVRGMDRGEVKQGSFLDVELSGPLHDAPVQGGLVLDPQDSPPLVTEIAAAIREAAADERISGLYLDLAHPTGGWGSIDELRAAVEAFGSSGKPCVAFSEGYTTASYYLASACDRIVLAPAGLNLVTGLQADVTYYAGTFEKLGIEAEFEHVGEFKSAVEPLERSGPSESAQQAMDAVLDSLYEHIVLGISEGRGRGRDEVRAWIDLPSLSPQAALERGMVDALAFPDAVEALVHRSSDPDWVDQLGQPLPVEGRAEGKRFTSVREYLKGIRARERKAPAKVAVVHAEGTITSGEADSTPFGSGMLGDQSFRKWMQVAREDDQVRAVVLRVNSPGGSGLASDMMWREVQRTKAAGKPVVVSMGDLAASGGYYISAPADWIIAQPSTLTGSIGVFGGKLVLSGTYEKLGLTQHHYERGDEANLLSMSTGFSPEGREVFREFLSDFYDVFLERVGEGRQLDREQVHDVAKGRVWTGAQALDRKLVDELGGLDVAVAKAAELAGIEGGVAIRRLPEKKGFLDLLMEDLVEARALQVELPGWLQGVEDDVLHDVLVLDRVLGGGGVAALWAGHPRY